MKILSVYYSVSGCTEIISRELNTSLIDMSHFVTNLRIEPENDFSNPISRFFLGGFAAIRKKKLPIKQTETSLKDYDMLVIGSPIWAGRLTPFMNTYVSQLKDTEGKKAITFVSSGTGLSGYRDAFEEILKEKNLELLARLSFKGSIFNEEEWKRVKEILENLG